MPDFAPKLPNFSPVGDSACLLELSQLLDDSINDTIYRIEARMQERTLKGVIEWVPGYASILVYYDPLVTTYRSVEDWLEDWFVQKGEKTSVRTKRVKILVQYGGEDGPDLEHVAAFHGMSASEVVRRHFTQIYKVGMMGFTPGFAYLLGLDPELNTPRLATPRKVVPGGSVGIAGSQTGIYPMDSPGGWQIIGRTEQVLFDPVKEPHFLLSPGDEVQFIAVDGEVVG